MDPIARLNAALDGRYRVERQLGEGGMATVYLADDLKHERKVALKVLKSELAAVVGAERFLAEIKTTANLQHPHILALYDSGEADGLLFYVMPHVDGESLRDRLDRERQLPVEDAVRIATNVAEALDYAHRQGVIHRDIKPANVMLQDGKPVIADFGIALAVGAAGGGRLTETGLSLGTPHYMSPEQATGDQNVGPATDIYALGCVLYEMLVGEPPFTGSTAQAVLGSIITGEIPSAHAKRSTVPPNVDAVIAKALEKVPADRFAGAAEFGKGLSDSSYGIERTQATSRAASSWKPLGIGAATTSVFFLLIISWLLSVADGPEPVRRVSIPVPGGFEQLQLRGSSLAISDDGSMIAYADNGDLYLRHLDADSAYLIEAGGDRSNPAFSPDGEFLSWRRGGSTETMRVSVNGGLPTSIGRFNGSYFGTDWGEDDRIYMAYDNTITSFPASGGEAEVVVEVVDAAQLAWPQLLEDGDLLLFTAVRGVGKPRDSEILIQDLRSGERTVLVREGAQGRYVESGHLLYTTSDGEIMAQRLDLGTRSVEGPAVAVADGVLQGEWAGGAVYAVSDAGVLALVRGDTWSQSQLMWFDRAGGTEPFGPPVTGYGFEVNPQNEDVVAVSASGPESDDVFLWEAGASPVRLSDPRVANGRAIWSPDGTRIAWQVDGEDGSNRIVGRSVVEGGALEVLFERAAGNFFATDWSPDGRYLALEGDGLGIEARLAVLDLETSQLRPIINERGFNPQFSPDGRWISYGVTGREIVVASFDDDGSPPQTAASGFAGRWDRSGRSLYFGSLTGVPREWVLQEARIAPGTNFGILGIDTLFTVSDGFEQLYSVAPDGQRFLIKVRNTEASPQFIDLIFGFDQELERLVPN